MEETKDQHCEDCCGHCHTHGMGGKYHLLRWVLGVAIILIVFWLGFKLGEFKGYFGSYDGSYFGRGYGRGMMMNYFEPGDNTYYLRTRQQQDQTPWSGGMMWQQAPASSTTPTK